MKAQLIAAALADRAEDVAQALLGKPTQTSASEMRWGTHGSFSLRRTGSKRGFYFDHEQGEGGDLLHLLARKRGVSIGEAMQIAERDFIGSTVVCSVPMHDRPATNSPVERISEADSDEKARIAAALRLWGQAVPIAGTLGERYLIEHRQLDVHDLDLQHVLKWHAGQHCMIALMTDAVTNEPRGVHRTFLSPEGAKIERRMLGKKGVIRLSPDEDATLGLGICEGIEDALAVILSGWKPVWAAADAGSIAKFPVLAGIEALTIFADGDTAGESASSQCVARWREAGKEARCLPMTGGRPA